MASGRSASVAAVCTYRNLTRRTDAGSPSTISRTRRLGSTWRRTGWCSAWVLGLLADRGLIQGKRVGVDATTLEASAAMRSIVRRDTGESYEEFLTTGLARASGIGTPTREQLARLDRKRKKRTSNKEWMSPTDSDARVTKMKRWSHALGAYKGRTRGGPGHRGGSGRVTLREADRGGHDHVGPHAVRGRCSGWRS